MRRVTVVVASFTLVVTRILGSRTLDHQLVIVDDLDPIRLVDFLVVVRPCNVRIRVAVDFALHTYLSSDAHLVAGRQDQSGSNRNYNNNFNLLNEL